jgi:hypothetical protein
MTEEQIQEWNKEDFGNLPDGFFLSQSEIDELRNQKYELTEYGKEKLRKLMNTESYPDDMFEIAERREKSNRVLQRYNDFYNLECSGLPHGTPITPEQQQALTLDCMIAALRCENLNREYNEIAIADIEDLIEALYQQSITFLERTKKLKDEEE